ncbi:MAG: phosphoribosylaminoimidazolecarboxamide formyltransferase / IMP cyclohydrolase [Candidatus Tokpelaia sp. JSC085]|nr:MAG: phosphoribosylaminoimidazolecarboxamide formyltransferase / IMP cyclohydrolase [Candidatus Tokpelaia sp. JSC085]
MAVKSKKRTQLPDMHLVRRALVSVFNKQKLVKFATSLVERGIILTSTGGTAHVLKKAGLPVQDISDVTHFPEIMDGRVKTLHPAVYGALLGIRDDPEHAEIMRQYGIEGIDLVIVNLYPFEEVCQWGAGADNDTVIESIDIGGPSMIRAAAKNHAYTAVVTDPDDYDQVLDELNKHDGYLSFAYRRQLAERAYMRTAAYDVAISKWFSRKTEILNPMWYTIAGKRHSIMRYGENPHQAAGFYVTGEQRYGVTTAKMVQGKPLSYNNINDADAAFELISEFNPEKAAAVAIIKHANPCGVAEGKSLKEAYLKALVCDPVSAFGGVIALNCSLDAEVAEEIVKVFTEVIIAPDITADARCILAQKQNIRLLVTGGVPDPYDSSLVVRSVSGGLLIQTRDNSIFEETDLKVVTQRQPVAREWEDMKFAFRVAKHVKSNAIVYAKDMATLGIGAGQMNRLDSACIAAHKARKIVNAASLSESLTKGCVVASDAFFPFADGLLSAFKVGASAAIQPGGSIRDEEIIAVADANDMAMVMTGVRHFKH